MENLAKRRRYPICGVSLYHTSPSKTPFLIVVLIKGKNKLGNESYGYYL